MVSAESVADVIIAQVDEYDGDRETLLRLLIDHCGISWEPELQDLETIIDDFEDDPLGDEDDDDEEDGLGLSLDVEEG